MILRQIERIRRSASLDGIVVATSTDSSDDRLAELLEYNDIEVRRGSLDNVLARFLQVVDEFNPDTVVRLTGDNPLTDPDVIDLVVGAHNASSADYSSNSRVRTFPYGLDVECTRAGALRELTRFDLRPDELEHVTLGIYTRPEIFDINSVTQPVDHSDLRWSVDYPADFEFAQSVYLELYESNPLFNQQDVLDLIDRRPELRRAVTDVPT